MVELRPNSGYVSAKRFLRDFPTWFEVVRATVTAADRSNGEFAGAWALNEARKLGIEWFPNLRPLVGYGLLRRTDVTRGGRRAYYAMDDIAGVKSALGEIEREINNAATEAIGNRMYCLTFGIVGDAKGGAEGRSLGTGIGIRWGKAYVILTAAHVIEQTPDERLYFLLPGDTLIHPSSAIPVKNGQVELRRRSVLEKPDVLLSDDFDLAAVILEGQPEEVGKYHFYDLDRAHATPSTPTQAGFLGYPGASAIPVGQNFMSTVYYDFGQIGDVPPIYDQQSQVSVNYPPKDQVDPHGLSGSGMWFVPPIRKKLWAPDVSLAGLVTRYDYDQNVLIGYKVEKLIEFLDSKAERLRNKSESSG
jgi:hypothetical protein